MALSANSPSFLRTCWPLASRRAAALTLFLAGLLLALPARGEDWPMYRGPHHDGTSDETGIADAWKASEPRLLWKVPMGAGFGTFAVSGKQAFVLAEREGNEVCVALDAGSGKTQWAYTIDKTISDHEGGSNPRTTPTVEGGRVYAMSTFLKLYCLNAANGQLIWRRDLAAEAHMQKLHWGNAASPIIDGDKIFIGGGPAGQSMFALNKQTGAAIWATGSEKLTHASPVPCTILGVRQVVFFMQSGLVALKEDDGRELWRFKFPYSVSTAASPVVGGKNGDIVYCSAGYGVGGGACRIEKQGDRFAATELWRTPGQNVSHWSTPVYSDGCIYGVFGFKEFRTAPLRCIDIETGKERWSQPGFGSGGGTILVDHHVLVQSDFGPITLADASPDGYKETGHVEFFGGDHCWAAAIIANGRIYARSKTEAVCIEVKGK